jgi:hypothetical protein
VNTVTAVFTKTPKALNLGKWSKKMKKSSVFLTAVFSLLFAVCVSAGDTHGVGVTENPPPPLPVSTVTMVIQAVLSVIP